jgi:hypothetical protein
VTSARACKQRAAGRPLLTDTQAAEQAAHIIEVATALHRKVSDAELARRWGLTFRQANALVNKRQRHRKVLAYLGDSLADLMPGRNLLDGAARLALSLVDANPGLSITAAIRQAAQRVRVTGERDEPANPVRNIPRRVVEFGEVDVAGVRRAVKRIQNGGGN